MWAVGVSRRHQERGGREEVQLKLAKMAGLFKGNIFLLNVFPLLEIMENGGHLILELKELEPLVQSV